MPFTKLTQFIFLGVLLLLPGVLFSPFAQAEETYVINCTNATEKYFIRPQGILFAMTGVGKRANCLVVIDTEGKQRVICNTENSADTCEIAEVLLI